MHIFRSLYCFRFILSLTIIAFLTGCGGNDGGSSISPEANPSYSLSGKVNGERISNVTIVLSGAISDAVKTDGNGNFSFYDLPNGLYTVAPNGPFWYAYNPVSQAVTIKGTNVSGINFISSASNNLKSSVSGYITAGGIAKQGVLITLSGTSTGTAATDSSGYYSFSGLIDGRYTLTPSVSSYSFTPTTQTVWISGGNSTALNFTATSDFEMVNNKFNGTYNVEFTIDACNHQSFTEIIGNDSSRREDFGGDDETQYYLYIPASENSLLYAYSSDGDLTTREITISGNTIIIDESWEEDANSAYTGHFELMFSNDYDSFSISGYVEEADLSECQGTVTGTGIRQ